jgi:hypothetical protein
VPTLGGAGATIAWICDTAEYNHLRMETADNAFTAVDPCLVGILNNRNQPGRGHDHITHQLCFAGYDASVTVD